jgi:hypothetical protein
MPKSGGDVLDGMYIDQDLNIFRKYCRKSQYSACVQSIATIAKLAANIDVVCNSAAVKPLNFHCVNIIIISEASTIKTPHKLHIPHINPPTWERMISPT